MFFFSKFWFSYLKIMKSWLCQNIWNIHNQWMLQTTNVVGPLFTHYLLRIIYIIPVYPFLASHVNHLLGDLHPLFESLQQLHMVKIISILYWGGAEFCERLFLIKLNSKTWKALPSWVVLLFTCRSLIIVKLLFLDFPFGGIIYLLLTKVEEDLVVFQVFLHTIPPSHTPYPNCQCCHVIFN